MLGAPVLSARAAFRTGCGLVKLAMPASLLQSALLAEPCATGIALPQKDNTQTNGAHLSPSKCAEALDQHLPSANVIALGPGFGIGFGQQQIMMRLLASDTNIPVVLDADGLNNLAKVPAFQPDIRAPLVVTPHPGEFDRMATALEIPALTSALDDDRCAAASTLAQRLACIVILKGARTVVSDGQRTSIIASVGSTAVLATAGSGDVLTGILASIVAQFWKPFLGQTRPVTPAMQGGLSLLECAALAVDTHVRSGHAWSATNSGSQSGMRASELADAIPSVVEKLRTTSQ